MKDTRYSNHKRSLKRLKLEQNVQFRLKIKD